MWTRLPLCPLTSWLCFHLCQLHSETGSHYEVAEVAASNIRRCCIMWAALMENLFSPVVPAGIQWGLSWPVDFLCLLLEPRKTVNFPEVPEDGNGCLASRSTRIHHRKVPCSSRCWCLFPGHHISAALPFSLLTKHPGQEVAGDLWPFNGRRPYSPLQSLSTPNTQHPSILKVTVALNPLVFNEDCQNHGWALDSLCQSCSRAAGWHEREG